MFLGIKLWALIGIVGEIVFNICLLGSFGVLKFGNFCNSDFRFAVCREEWEDCGYEIGCRVGIVRSLEAKIGCQRGCGLYLVMKCFLFLFLLRMFTGQIT